MNILLIFPVAIVLSFVLTAIFRHYALRHSLVDIPNKRSSHTVPTPRGGGLAFVLSFLLLMSPLQFFIEMPVAFTMALFGAGSWVAFVGFFDDHTHVAARWRLLAHFVGALWALIWLGGLPPVLVFGRLVDFGSLGNVVIIVYLIWVLNLYNFMDGIDGIAGIEAITVCLAAGILELLIAPNSPTWVISFLLASSVFGFLFWNFPQALIFMGDAGSGFLGLLLGILSIHAAWTAPQLLWSWLILLGVFNVDATLTLVRRISGGEKFYVAHCNHAYQHAARKFGAHWSVSLVVGALNIFWLFPVALLVALNMLEGIFGLTVAYVPLIWLAIKFKAGKSEQVS